MSPNHPLLLLICLLALALLAGCVLPGSDGLPIPLLSTPTPPPLPDQCLGDGAVQSWRIEPLDPPEAELLAAYQAGQIIDFQAEALWFSDDPARLPLRSFTLHELAEGITVTLDYLGDPPPLMLGQNYHMIAWANAASSELQVVDETGLLFLGATDVNLQDDPLAISLSNGASECPVVPAAGERCLVSRQVVPLELRWGDQALTLYPGEDARLVHDNALFQVSLFRNRLVTYADPPCPDFLENERSLRIERLQPPPQPPTLLIEPITATTPITGRFPITDTPIDLD